MTDEQVVVAAAIPVALDDNKRKLEDLEPQQHPEPTKEEMLNGDSNLKSGDFKTEEIHDADEQDAKKPRLDQKPADANENGHQVENIDQEKPMEYIKNEVDQELSIAASIKDEQQPDGGGCKPEEISDTQNPIPEDNKGTAQLGDSEQPLTKEKPEGGDAVKTAGDEGVKVSAEENQGNDSVAQEQSSADPQATSRKMEVPNNKVGVLIGKAGETIRNLQMHSGAKIQITRDAEADPRSATRPVELVGSLESIEKAEKLINDVINEAEAGGVPSLVARGMATAQAAAVAEQVQMQVPNDKVGMIIGKGGETIKYLQQTSGARIQLIPQHLPEGDQSKERTVRISGDKKQIEVAREMIMEVMTQPMRHSPHFGGYNQQSDRYRGAWGPRGGHYGPPSGYDYHQRAFPLHYPQHRPPTYGHYSGPHHGPRSGYGSGWQQPPPMQRPPYDNYGRPGGHFVDGPAGAPGLAPPPHMGHIPSQTNYNYGQSHTDYGPQAPYSHAYGHGYDEMKYGNQAPVQHSYGGQANTQQPYLQGQPGYAPPDQQYGKPAAYATAMPSQPPAPQTYGPPRPIQPEAAYQGTNPAAVQQYGQTAPTQPAPYATAPSAQPSQYATAATQPSYPTYPTTDGYSQPQPAATSSYVQQAVPDYTQPGGQQAVPNYAQPGAQQAVPNYTQPGAQQAVPGYTQPGGHQAPGVYGSQVTQPGPYASYPASQPSYPDQSAANVGAYGYQAAAMATDPNAVYGAQQAYSQPQPVQPATYDQSLPQ